LSFATDSPNPGIAFVSGAFHARFDGEDATRAAARDATGAGFTACVRVDGAGGWLVVCQRRGPFPADEQERYAGRVRAIATKHGGAYDRFIAD
jgi:hypothetical protein